MLFFIFSLFTVFSLCFTYLIIIAKHRLWFVLQSFHLHILGDFDFKQSVWLHVFLLVLLTVELICSAKSSIAAHTLNKTNCS